MNKSLVSIHMVTYNQRDFVGPAIESVLMQDYPCYELVIGDDCSTDGTWEIIQEYQLKYPEKIIAFRNERNIGITANCNEVLKRCSGKFIAFFAGDDLFLPGKISKQVAAMEADENIVLSYHDIEIFNSKTGEVLRYWNHGFRSHKPVVGPARLVANKVVATANSIMGAMSVMVRRDAIPHGGFDARVPYVSDWLMWIEVLAGANDSARVVFLPEVLARYRRHENNITNRSEMYIVDPYVTLAVAESKYPWLIASARKGLARLRYYRGTRFILEGKRYLGRKFLLESLKDNLVSYKFFYWLAVSFFPSIRQLHNYVRDKSSLLHLTLRHRRGTDNL